MNNQLVTASANVLPHEHSGYLESAARWSGDAALWHPGVHNLRAGFLHNVEHRPHHAALHVKKHTYSYAEAADIARRWAARLVDIAEGLPRRVGVFASRSETSYLGVLASLMAGATFVPLNPKFPLERTRAMIEQGDLDAVLVDNEALPQLPAVLRDLPGHLAILAPATEGQSLASLVPGPVFGRAELMQTAPLQALPEVGSDDIAYLLFTSGSTGAPKGVPITYGNVRAFLDHNLERYQLTPADRLSQTFDQTFDLSIFDLFMAWESGACVCSMEPIELLAPFRFLEQQQITVWFSVPSVAALLLKRGALIPGRMPGLRWSLFCGEALPRATAEAWQAAAPHAVLENLYGPTELTIACAAYRWHPEQSPQECVQDLVPIGEVYPGLAHLVVDETLREVAAGDVGELCVAGAQTSPGYWHAPELTASRFFERIAPDGTARRYYRTGDLVRRAPNYYAYLGRQDQQVKLGGYRIELGEIEAILRRAGCVEAVALLWPNEHQAESIIAVVSGSVDVAQVSAVAGQYLPNYMVPRSIQVVEEMPLNANGKVDRNALRQRVHDWLARA